MKKIRLLFLGFVIFAFFFILPFGVSFQTFAVGLTPDITYTNYSTTYNFDETLFNVLRVLAQKINNDIPVAGFNTDLFYGGDNYGEYSPALNSDGEKIIDDLNNGILNLTTGENAEYDCLKNFTKITSITGLNDLDLVNIETLILDNNQISDISDTQLSSLISLKTLSVADNCLQNFSQNSNIVMLNDLDLSKNFLTEIDISKLASSNGLPKCNLSNNRFEDALSDITYPGSNLSYLDLSFNYLTSLTQDDVDSLNEKVPDGILNLYVQGFNVGDELMASQKVLVVNQGNVENFNVVVSYFEGNENISASVFYDESADNIIYRTDWENMIETFFVPAGKIKIEFFGGSLKVNKINFAQLEDYEIENLKDIIAQVSLFKPAFKVFVNGKPVTDFNQSENLKIRFEIFVDLDILNFDDIFDENNGAKIFAGFVGEVDDETPKNIITITQNGSYSVTAYVVFDGIISQSETINVLRKNYAGAVWAIIIIITIMVIIFSVYYTLRWYKDGANIAPLTDREIYRVNKQRQKRIEETESDYISKLELPRHNHRVTDIDYDDDFIDIKGDDNKGE